MQMATYDLSRGGTPPKMLSMEKMYRKRLFY